MRGFYRRTLFVLSLAVMPARLAVAQSTGSLSGIVQDPSGGNVPGADITLKHLGTNREYGAVSSESGTFSFPALLFGDYELKVTAEGFRPFVILGVAVHVGLIAPVTINLELAGVAEQVTVRPEGQRVINTL